MRLETRWLPSLGPVHCSSKKGIGVTIYIGLNNNYIVDDQYSHIYLSLLAVGRHHNEHLDNIAVSTKQKSCQLTESGSPQKKRATTAARLSAAPRNPPRQAQDKNTVILANKAGFRTSIYRAEGRASASIHDEATNKQ